MYGDWLPRHIYGKGTAFCAIIRMIYLSIVAATLYRNFGANSSDMKRVKLVVIIDGVSAPIPILHWAGLKTIFYCHFPDMVSLLLLPFLPTYHLPIHFFFLFTNLIMYLTMTISCCARIGKAFSRDFIASLLIA